MYEHALFVKRVLYKETQNMKKKIALLLPAFFLALSLGACNNKKSEEQKSGGDEQQQPAGGDQTSSGGDQGGESQGGEQGGEQQGGEQGGESGGEQGGESGGETAVDPTQVKAAVVIASKAYELTTATLDPAYDGTATEKYTCDVASVAAGDSLVFYYDGAAVTENIGPASGAANLGEAVEGGFAIKSAATNVKVYFHIYGAEDPAGHSFWIEGTASGGEQQGGGEQQTAGQFSVLFTVPKDWGEHIYLYEWKGEAANAEWPGVELTESTTNGYGEKQVTVTLDGETYETFVLSDGTDSHKTADLTIADYASVTGIYLDNGVAKTW